MLHDGVVELLGVVVNNVCKFGPFELAPEEFNGIQIGSIRGKGFDRQSWML